jgi:hypothetical protein
MHMPLAYQVKYQVKHREQKLANSNTDHTSAGSAGSAGSGGGIGRREPCVL